MTSFYDRLQTYCEENDVTLKWNYADEKLRPFYKIEGTCTTDGCENEFYVPLKRLLTGDSAFCEECTNEHRKCELLELNGNGRKSTTCDDVESTDSEVK